MTTEKYKPQLNFVNEMALSKKGIIDEIKTDLTAMMITLDYGKDDIRYNDAIDKILAINLRKLLCEKKNNVLEKVCPDFKMPPLKGNILHCDKLSKGFCIVCGPYSLDKDINNWISINEWREQNIAYHTIQPDDVYPYFDNIIFKQICNKMKPNDKDTFKGLFTDCFLECMGKTFEGKKIKSVDYNGQLLRLLNKIGYYDLSLYTFIKHLTDKTAAHIDYNISFLIKTINANDLNIRTPIKDLSFQLIYAIKTQIPYFRDFSLQNLKCNE